MGRPRNSRCQPQQLGHLGSSEPKRTRVPLPNYPPLDLDRINRRLRIGGTLFMGVGSVGWLAMVAVVYEKVLFGGHPFQLAATPLLFLGLTGILLGLMVRDGWRARQTLLTTEGLVVGGETTAPVLRWSEVTRVEIRSQEVTLERQGQPPYRLPLQSALRATEVRNAVCARVPQESRRLR